MLSKLPIVKIDGKHYYRDDRLREYRLTTNPLERIAFEDIGDRTIEIVQQKQALGKPKRKLR